MSEADGAESRPPPGRRRARRWVVPVALGVVVALALVWWVRREDSEDRRTAEVRVGSLGATVETTGVVEPSRPVVLRAGVAGTLETVAVRPGDAVARGDIVAVIERAPYLAAVAEADAALEAAELAVTLAAGGTGAEDAAETLAAAGRLRAAELGLSGAERDLAATVVTAHASGIVLEVAAEEGGPATAGAPLATVAGDGAYRVAAELDELDVPLVPVGSAVRATVDAFPGQELEGRVTAVAPIGERAGAGTVFAATVEVPGLGGLPVRSGMSVGLRIAGDGVEGAPLVPAEAVEVVGRRSYVTVRRDGERVRVEITPGRRADGLVEVAGGEVRAGERVELVS